MSAVKASDMVRLYTGEVGTLASFLDAGRLTIDPVPCLMESKRSKSGMVTKYFAHYPEDNDRCFEIGKALWESRLGLAFGEAKSSTFL